MAFIELDTLRQFLKEEICGLSNSGELLVVRNNIWEDAFEFIPIIENKPKGEWIKESDYKVMGDGYMWECSECGNRVYVDSNGLFPNYCEDCGADMRGEE